MAKKLRVTYVRSGISYPKRQKATIKALGFTRLNQTVIHEENDALLGMLNKVSHLIEIESVPEEK